MYNPYFGNTAVSWRDKFNEFRAGRQEVNKYFALMSDAERMMARELLQKKRGEMEQSILNGAFGELDAAVNKFNSKLAGVKKEKQKERARWDAGRLNDEMEFIRNRVKIALDSSPDSVSHLLPNDVRDRMTNIYRDAFDSGDLYKQRAASEVFSSLVSIVGNDFDRRLAVNFLEQKAKKDAEECRDTPELQTAHKEAEAALEEVNQAKKTLYEVDAGMGYSVPGDQIGNQYIREKLSSMYQSKEGLKFADNWLHPPADENMFDF